MGDPVADLLIIRAVFVLVLTVAAFALHPFGLNSWASAAIGLVGGAFIVLFEIRLEKLSLTRLIGAAFGSILGIIGALMISIVLGRATSDPYLQVCLLL